MDFQNLFLAASQVRRGNIHHYTKFHQNASNGCKDIVFNDIENVGRATLWYRMLQYNWSEVMRTASVIKHFSVSQLTRGATDDDGDIKRICIPQTNPYPNCNLLSEEVM